MNRLIVADSAGFCFGVKRSVEIAEELLNSSGNVKSLGQLIHNNDVIDYLGKKGLCVIKSCSEAGEGDTVLIRAHGAPENVYSSLDNVGATVVDATCPKVKNIHNIVKRASEEGDFVIIVGMKEHPEVEGIRAYAQKASVFENACELKCFLENNPKLCEESITLVVQTTQTRNNFQECSDIAKKMCTNLRIFDTICLATSTRQEEASKIASDCDAVVVIGGKHSANSVHLAEICGKSCSHIFFVENAEELDTKQLKAFQTVGLTAGASVPSWIIKEVINKMSDEIKVEETKSEEELSFDEMLEGSLKPIYNGDKVTGIVVAISATEISVDLGTKYSGFIPTAEFLDAGEKVEDCVKLGDTVEAVVVRVNDVEGTAQLSKKRLDASKAWVDLESAVESGAVLEGVVTEENKGGVVVNVKGARVFVPASQTDLPREAELSQLLKKTVRLRVTEVNKARKRVIGSIRSVSQAEKRERRDAIWNDIEVGKKYTGTVKSLTSYGAFVDIGGIDGMVHVSELSWGRVRKPEEVIAVGDEIEVYVINFDKEKRKISLGYKDPEANPWKVFTKAYSVGDVASVKVVKLMDFGAFAEVVPGVDGLIHISQIANRRVEKPGEVLNVGDVVEAKIIAVDEEKQKISLSIRALAEPEAADSAEAEEEVSGEDALVFEISENGETQGEVPEETPAEE